jgi:hypothetical protein
MTKGETLVRISFNPNGNAKVNEIKEKVADLIDYIEENKDLDGRLAALAITSLEEAAMWGVKLVTTEK